MTSSQLATLRAAIDADTALAALPRTSDAAATISAAFNLDASPTFYVWRTRVTKNDIVSSTSRASTTFSWSGAGGFIARSVGEQAAWSELFGVDSTIDPSQPAVRAAFADIFSGSGAAAINNRTHMGSVCRRLATRFERLYATGTGTDDTSAGTLVLEGPLSPQDVISARNL